MHLRILRVVFLIPLLLVYCNEKDPKTGQEVDYEFYQLSDSEIIAGSKLIWQDSAVSQIRKYNYNGNAVLTVTEQRYHGFSDTVIREKTSFMYIGAEDNRSRLTAEAIRASGRNSAKILWSFTEEADRGEEWSGFYRTTEDGCCATAPLYRLHRWSDGELILVHNFELEEFSVSTTSLRSREDTRYVGVLCDIPDDLLRQPDDSLLLAVVFYASQDSLLHAITIRVADTSVFSRHYYWPDTVFVAKTDSILESVRLYPDSFRVALNNPMVEPVGADQSIVIGASRDGHVIVIPIKDDDFYLENPRFTDYELIRMN
jgi:hypothetical protein